MEGLTDHEVRQKLIEDFLAFLARCTRGHAVLESVATEHALPSYLLGLMNTGYLAYRTGPVTEAGLRAMNPGSERSRFGAEHWMLLVERNFAVVVAGGWALTASGVSMVLELHRALRDEVARKRAPEGVVLVLLSDLVPLARRIPSSPRIATIRALWTDDEVPLVRLYRAVWELYGHRRAIPDDSYFSGWPTASKVESIGKSFTTLLQDLT